VLLVAVCLAAGVPIGFCFGLATICYLAFATTTPLTVVVSRMDEGMSSIILVSVPVFVLLGCVLDSTGMGKAIVDVLASLLGHMRAGMSYVLLGSLFIVSGISGSKVSGHGHRGAGAVPRDEAPRPQAARDDRAAGHRRGHGRHGAAVIVLIVLGSVAGVSIAGLFQSGFVMAMVLLAALLVLARWKARHEVMDRREARPLATVGKLLLLAAPALVLPFLIRGAVGGGVATATEVSTIAVLYALLIGKLLYGGLSAAPGLAHAGGHRGAQSGAILLILGTASGMAWAIAQSG
jgi:TRAP-type C4-dicarboxylate transport system permease large subunit